MGYAKRLGRGLPHISRTDLRPLLKTSCGTPCAQEADGSVVYIGGGTGSPLFEVAGPRMARGWYMAEVLVESDQSFMDGGFEVIQAGGDRSRLLRLPLRTGRLSKRLIWLRHGGEQLRFKPMCCDGSVTIRKLSLVRVSLPFVRNRMRNRLASRYLPVPARLIKRWVSYDLTFHPNGARVSYGEWIRHIEPTLWPRRTAAGRSVRFAFVVPVSGDDIERDIKGLVRSLESIFAQPLRSGSHSVYLLLCGVSDSLRSAVNALVEGDPRVSVIDAREAVQLSRVVPAGVAAVICPPRGTLSPFAARCFAEVLSRVPNARLIYADEDSIGDSGRRAAPKFKPAWNPDLLYSQNYIGDFFLLSPAHVASLHPLDFSDSSWSLALLLHTERCAATGDNALVHIPRVLFHRQADSSVGRDEYALERNGEVLRAHFQALGQEDVKVVTDKASGQQSVSWPVGEVEPLVSLLIPTRDMLPVLKWCVDSILAKTTYCNYEILILDNQSQEPDTHAYFAELERRENIRILRFDAPFNYSAINNFGVRHARGDIIGLVNNDIEVINPEWLNEMVGHAQRPDVGCVGAKLFYSDGRIQHAGVVVGLGGLAGHVHKFLPADAPGYMNRLQSTQAFSAVTAACLLVRKATFEAVGGLNERQLQVAFNDVDFCLKVQKAGLRNIWTPYAKLYHHESVSRGIDNTREKRARFERESKYLRDAWSEYLASPGKDPYYSPFLTHIGEDFSLGLNEKRDIPLYR